MDNRPLHEPQRHRQVQLWLLALIALVVVGWALHVMAVVFVPIVFAMFVALVVAPVDSWVAEQVPDKLRWLGHLAALGLVLLALAIFFGSLWIAATRVAGQFPDGASGISVPAVGDDADGGAAGMLSQIRDVFDQAGIALGDRVRAISVDFARTLLTSAGTMLAGIILAVFLTLMMLVEGGRWRRKLAELADGEARDEWLHTFSVVSRKLRRYLLARTAVGVLTAALYVLWLWIFGVDLLIVWGLLAFILNYIPNLGSLIAGVAPVAYAFVTKDLGTAALVAAGLLVIEQVMGNYVDPRVQGRQVAVSPVVILVVLILWGWIWGVAGAILAVPITIAILVICAHVRSFRPIALLLSNEPDMEGLERAAS